MNIKEIDKNVFDEFAFNHPLKSYFQTSMYAAITSPLKYEVMYMGAYENNVLKGASLILYKTIGISVGVKMKYGYAPRGFLIDYYDKDFLDIFTSKLKNFFSKRGFAFIKINPEITYAKIDYKNQKKEVNSANEQLINSLKRLDYKKLRNNLYFESMLPRFNAIINYKDYDINLITDDFKDKLKNDICDSLFLTSGNEDKIKDFYELIKDKRNRTLQYYEDFYKIFKEKNMVDLLFIKLDYRIYLKNIQNKYYFENLQNTRINNQFLDNPTNDKYYQEKLESDKRLADLKIQLNKSTTLMQKNEFEKVIAGALLIKQGSRVNLIISGYDKQFGDIPNIYLYYKIIEEYKKLNYKFLDLNAISGDFTDKNPYKKMNELKLGFNPSVYEYIGEFDLICNNAIYQILLNTNTLQKEFLKPETK